MSDWFCQRCNDKAYPIETRSYYGNTLRKAFRCDRCNDTVETWRKVETHDTWLIRVWRWLTKERCPRGWDSV